MLFAKTATIYSYKKISLYSLIFSVQYRAINDQGSHSRDMIIVDTITLNVP